MYHPDGLPLRILVKPAHMQAVLSYPGKDGFLLDALVLQSLIFYTNVMHAYKNTLISCKYKPLLAGEGQKKLLPLAGAFIVIYKLHTYFDLGCLFIVNTFTDFLYHLFAEGRQVIGITAGYQSAVNYHFLIYPVSACIFHVGFNGMVRSDGAVF